MITARNSCDRRREAARKHATRLHRFAGRLLVAVAAILLAWEVGRPAVSGAQITAKDSGPSFYAPDLFTLKERCGSADAVEESFELTARHAFGGPAFGTKKIVAFEENRYFIYAVGIASDADEAAGRGRKQPGLLRRVVLLKPATFVVDDLVRRPTSTQPTRWLLHSPGKPKIDGRKIKIPGTRGGLVCESLLPEQVSVVTISRAKDGDQAAGNRVEVVAKGDPEAVRFLHVFHITGPGDEVSLSPSKLVEKDGRVSLTVVEGGRVFQLFFRSGRPGVDEIEVVKADGQTLLTRRLLPAGILPHGPEGTRLLERWDSAYRGDRRPGWDTGRPSSELKKAVEEGTLKPCRAVVLGCGLGTNAVFLASKAFDVTAIDIAPTALSRAEEKARKADVKVRFLLADVLAPPDLEPFDLIYDRGCYHGVRRQSAAGYVRAVRRLSHPGTRLLLLAGNANEAGRGGAPRIKEEQLRGDFSKLFDFEWLHETRFDTRNPAAKGPLAWSALLRRQKEP